MPLFAMHSKVLVGVTFAFVWTSLLVAAPPAARPVFVPPDLGMYSEELAIGDEGSRRVLLGEWDVAPRFASGSIATRIVFRNSPPKTRSADQETVRISIISGEVVGAINQAFDNRRSVGDYNPYNPNRRFLSGTTSTSWTAEMELTSLSQRFATNYSLISHDGVNRQIFTNHGENGEQPLGEEKAFCGVINNKRNNLVVFWFSGPQGSWESHKRFFEQLISSFDATHEISLETRFQRLPNALNTKSIFSPF